jgi:hypothetical protein
MSMRKNPRHPIRLRIIFDDGEEYVAGFIDNASATGLMLESPKPLPLGREIRLEPVDAAEDAWFELRARVTRCYPIDPDDGIARWGAAFYAIGVELIDLTAEQELAIRKSLIAIEKRALDPRPNWQ